MKSIAWAGALVAGILVGTTTGRPLINKRALVTEVVYVTETIANVALYVDENGVPYSTSTADLFTSISSVAIPTTPAPPQTTEKPAPTPAPQVPASSTAPAPPVTPSSAAPAPVFTTSSVEPSSVEVKEDTSTHATPEAPAPTSTEAQPSTNSSPPFKSAQPAPPPPASTSAVPVDTKGDSGSLGLGVTYDAFTGEGQNTQCKDPDRMTKEFDQMKDFKAIRIYAGDCSVIPIAVQSVLKNKQKLMAGAYLPQGDLSETIKAYKAAIDTYAKGDWSVIALFSVENEQVNGGYMTASDVVDAINRARTQLRSLGYNGPVGAVETVKAMVENPAICRAADVAMVNSHAFFDGNVLPEDSGTFVKSQVSMVKQACDNKRVVVTESGWPHEGDRHEKAVPSPQNQKAAIASIRENFDHDMFLFNAFDSPWKSNTAATFNAERFWGIM